MSGNSFEKRKRDRTRDALIAAYEAMVHQEPGSGDKLLLLVQKFIYSKVYHLEYEFAKFGSAETADDWAQEATIEVWKGLHRFMNNPKSTPALFYSWVHKIAFNKATDAFKRLLKEKATKVGLTVGTRDEYGASDGEDENPEIYEGQEHNTNFHIPASVKGVDYSICLLILAGMNYAQIAEELKLTEKAVRDRMHRLRKKLKEEKDAQRSNRSAKEAERRGGPARGLDALRKQLSASVEAAAEVNETEAEEPQEVGSL